MNQISAEFHPFSNLLTDNSAEEYTVAFSERGDVSWSVFRKQVASLACVLERAPEAKWALCAKDSYLFAVAFFALSHSNKEIILPGNYQPAALLELSSQFDAIIHDSAIASNDFKVSLDLEDASYLSGEEEVLQELNAQQTNITLFTSGSSGTPKAIRKTLYHFEEELRQQHQVWGDTITDTRVYSTVSHQHIYGLLFRLLYPLVTKRSFDRNNLEYPEQVVNCSADDAVLISSPALLKRLSSLMGQKPEQGYRAVFSSGGPLSQLAASQCEMLLGSLPFEVFGSTETGGIGYRQQKSESACWKLFPEVSARLDNNGCIALLAPHIDQNEWYQTTDKCTLLDNHQFILHGRVDRVIKIEEKRVSIDEIERRLHSLDDVEEVAAVTITTEERVIIAAVIVLTPAGQERLATLGKGKFGIELRNHLRAWLEPVAIPKRFRFVESIPVNSQGKRLNTELSALFNHQ
ncbi:AMP-binding protein [Vibrio hannami]|uniref:AMP-binding protein n=1 Tax=Vibrio hannami TaxID=2717094 RepID=UPI00241080D3|nr:AMP-binding protein [Vibrio hannami]MDG3087532.1 AMP-binding protein [Vibrio hannami]